MWTIRRLHLPTDLPLYRQAHTWLVNSPPWRLATEAVFGRVDWEGYIGGVGAPGRCDIGVFGDEGLIATVTLTLTARATYEVHFDAAPSASKAVVIGAGCTIRDRLFGQYAAQLAYTWTPRWNRGVLGINRAIGFTPDFVTLFRGAYRGRPIEWVRYSITAGG